jgi:hypothetical protein
MYGLAQQTVQLKELGFGMEQQLHMLSPQEVVVLYLVVAFLVVGPEENPITISGIAPLMEKIA